ncbi:hypothetical protein M885DRAFT_545937 [Pelagophyceae sp. CCMP2097]|nr:hypothetical protein M885DRAFT_545937 [Pelagophyceae sp. CCMP2097]
MDGEPRRERKKSRRRAKAAMAEAQGAANEARGLTDLTGPSDATPGAARLPTSVPTPAATPSDEAPAPADAFEEGAAAEARRLVAAARSRTLAAAAAAARRARPAPESSVAKRVSALLGRSAGGGGGGLRVDATGPALRPTLVDRASCLALERWALANGVTQRDVFTLYARYAAHISATYNPGGARKRPNRISLAFFQDLFDHTAAEPASLMLLPAMFVKDALGLGPSDQGEVDFARFALAGYAFCSLSPLALVVRFFRLVLDSATCRPGELLALKPFEELVALLNTGIDAPTLALLREAFEKRTEATFEEIVRCCLNMPALLWPLFQFQRLVRRKMPFAPPAAGADGGATPRAAGARRRSFWDAHALPCCDPDADAALYDAVAVHPRDEALLAAVEDAEGAWRLCARRLVGFARLRELDGTAQSGDYWLCAAQLDDCEDLLARRRGGETSGGWARALDSSAAGAGRFLRDRLGGRLGAFFLTLALDERQLQPGSLRDALRTGARVPLRCADDAEPGGGLGEGAVHRAVWTRLFDATAGRDFFYHVPSGLSIFADPSELYEFGGAAGRLQGIFRAFHPCLHNTRLPPCLPVAAPRYEPAAHDRRRDEQT